MEIDVCVCVCVPYSLSRPNRRQGFVEDQKASTHIPRRITTSFDDRFDSSAIKEDAEEEYNQKEKPKIKKVEKKINIYEFFSELFLKRMMKYEFNFFESFSRQIRR